MMATEREQSVFSLITSARPTFRNNYDRIAFAVHCCFVAEGCILQTTGLSAYSDFAFGTSDETGTEGWNTEYGDYTFLYLNPEWDSTILVRCLAMDYNLAVDVVIQSDFEPFHLEISLQDYLGDEDCSDYYMQYKNLDELIKSLDKEIFSMFRAVENESDTSSRYSDWELDPSLILQEEVIHIKGVIAIYKGTYCGQVVAIKEFKDTAINHERFDREFGILRKVRHKYIIQFIGVASKKLWIVTEFLSGGDVESYLMRMKREPKMLETVCIASNVAMAVHYLHTINVIHSSLKGSNLLMDEFQVVKLADFGTSRDISHNMTPNSGYYFYMAPEVKFGGEYNHKADVYSFGFLLCQLMTRWVQLPRYPTISPVNDKPAHARIPENAPERLKTLIERCWDKPTSRPEFAVIVNELAEIQKELNDKELKPNKTNVVGVGEFLSNVVKMCRKDNGSER